MTDAEFLAAQALAFWACFTAVAVPLAVVVWRHRDRFTAWVLRLLAVEPD